MGLAGFQDYFEQIPQCHFPHYVIRWVASCLTVSVMVMSSVTPSRPVGRRLLRSRSSILAWLNEDKVADICSAEEGRELKKKGCWQEISIPHTDRECVGK